LGIRVHPLKPRSKKPYLPGYTRLATTDTAQICAWWTKWPDANIGIITGAASNVIALDIDNRRGGEQSLRMLEAQHVELPVTWQYSTADGFRMLFLHPQGVQLRHGELAPGVELFSDLGNSNIVGPGSVHPTGHLYEWMDCYDPGSIPLAHTPDWVLDLAADKNLLSFSVENATPDASKIPVSARHTSAKNSEGHRLLLLASAATTRENASLDGAAVAGLFSDWHIVQRCLRVLGLRYVQRPGQTFRCPLHKPDCHPSAAICRPLRPGQPYTFSDFHHHEGEPTLLPLPMLYYCLKTGAPTSTRLNPPSLLTWTLRLLIEADVLEPVSIKAPKLKNAVPEGARKVYEGFVHLLSVKWCISNQAPSPFTWRFACQWVGVSERTIRDGIRWLLSRGYLRIVSGVETLTLFVLGVCSGYVFMSDRT
jgi:hypothetical protein